MEKNDAELIQRTLDGDQRAFAALVEKYQKGIHADAWKRIGDFHIAQEITQDAFLRAYQELGTLKNRNAFAGWLNVIAIRLCLDWLRTNRLPVESLDTTDASEVDEVAYTRYMVEKRQEEADEARRETVKKLLRKLPESERTVMTLHYLGEMTVKAIAEFLGVSPNTIKSRLSRARNRLKKEEDMIRQNLSSFQLPTHFTENIMKEVSRLTPGAPSGSKPLVPWAVSAAAVLVLLLMGVGTQYLSHFQKPYSLDATSEPTVELTEALFVLNSPAKPAVRNQAGRAVLPGKSDGAGQKPDALRFAAARVDETKVSTPKPQWTQTKGPEGGFVNTLFTTTLGDIYAGTGSNLYRLSDDGRTWNLVNASMPIKGLYYRNVSWLMTERGDTLYVVSDTEVLASTDRGETWESLGEHPKGQPIGIVITDDAFYLGFVEGVFRSLDAGKSWTPLSDGNLADRKIRSLAAVENTVFVGTDKGLYRRNSEGWEQLPVGEAENIRALASAAHRLYVAVGEEVKNQVTSQFMSAMTTRKASLALYRSTDLGDSWQAIAPTKVLPSRRGGFTFGASDDSEAEPTSSLKIVAAQESLLVLDSGNSYYSSDAGETWITLHSSFSDMDKAPAVVMLNKNTFYRGGRDGIHRTTDAGKTWHQLNTGLVSTGVVHLVSVHDVLYANIGHALVSSTDGGDSWIPVPGGPGNLMSLVGFNDVLYARGAEGVKPRLFRLSSEDNRLILVPGMPDFGSGIDNERMTEEINRALLATLQDEGKKSIEGGKKLNPEHFDVDKFNEAYSKIMKESMANYVRSFLGSFAVSSATYYIESDQKLFRWKPGTTEWFDTGLIDEGESAYAFGGFTDFASVGFKLAVSGRTVYVGKRDGSLFQSFDEGNSWNDVTANLPFPVDGFKAIAFAGSSVYVATDKGVAYSSDGINWHAATDTEGTPLVIEQFAVEGTTVYATTEQQVYQLKAHSGTWKQVTPEIPNPVSSLAVDGNTLYVGTVNCGVLRFALDK